MSTRLTPLGNGRWRAETTLRGPALLGHPRLNRGSAFTPEERGRLEIEGLLPSVVSTIDVQAQRIARHLDRKADPLEKYIGLVSLRERNEVLFYKVLSENLEALMPIVYTPTVGDAAEAYSRIYRHAHGVWITPEHRGRIESVLRNAAESSVRLVVVTDNERILGLGDQGAGGMGIPVGKLALYTVCAGIHPSLTLPISLDVGTDNQSLLEDDLYIGYRKERLRGEAYASLVEEMVQAIKTCFPGALLQWEDFKKQNAIDILSRYRGVLPSFNDDIEGTAAVALAGVLAAGRARNVPLQDERIVIAGAGAAGLGIARLLKSALEGAGLAPAEAERRVAVTDSRGLLIKGETGRDAYKEEIAWPREWVASLSLSDSAPAELRDVVIAVKPTVLIGTTGLPGTFSEDVVRAMSSYADRPVIFPFSNPTKNSEATPRDLLEWSEGRALVATGSPFGHVNYQDRSRRIGQGNNVYVYPGLGLGCLVGHVGEVRPSMFSAAAKALAETVTEADLREGALFPAVARLREVSQRVAEAVLQQAYEEGVATSPSSGTDLSDEIQRSMWAPNYPEIWPVETL